MKKTLKKPSLIKRCLQNCYCICALVLLLLSIVPLSVVTVSVALAQGSSNPGQLSEYAEALDVLQRSRARVYLADTPEFLSLLPPYFQAWVKEQGGDFRLEAFGPYRATRTAPRLEALRSAPVDEIGDELLPGFSGFSRADFQTLSGTPEDRVRELRGDVSLIGGEAIVLPAEATPQLYRERINITFPSGRATWLTFALAGTPREERLWIASTAFPRARANPSVMRSTALHGLAMSAATLLGLRVNAAELEFQGELHSRVMLVPLALRAVTEKSTENGCTAVEFDEGAGVGREFGGRPIVQRVRNLIALSPAEVVHFSLYVRNPLSTTRRIDVFAHGETLRPWYVEETDLANEMVAAHLFAGVADADIVTPLLQLSLLNGGLESLLQVERWMYCNDIDESRMQGFSPGELFSGS